MTDSHHYATAKALHDAIKVRGNPPTASQAESAMDPSRLNSLSGV